MEESGFEPPNPKERIYSPPRLATSLLLHRDYRSTANFNILPKNQSFFKTFAISFFQDFPDRWDKPASLPSHKFDTRHFRPLQRLLRWFFRLISHKETLR